MYDIDIYNDSAIILERKMPSKIFSWITILIIAITIFILLSIFLKFNKYETYLGIIDNNRVIIYYDSKDIPFKNHLLFIDGKNYTYQVESVNSEAVYMESKKYYEVVIKLEQTLDFSSNLLNVTFKGEKTTLFNELKRKVRDSYKRFK